MSLTPAQLITLKTDIDANSGPGGDFENIPLNSDGAAQIADLYNVLASPDFTVWKSKVSLSAVGKSLNGDELANLTTAESNRIQVMFQISPGGIEPANEDRRDFFDDVFNGAGGTITRPQLDSLWRRLAKRGEKLFSTGVGSDPNPAILVVEGNLRRQDVEAARELL